MLSLALALLAGVATVAAPCTLPMLPILLGVSIGQTGKARPAMIALGFVMSFSAVALLLSAITRAFDFDPNLLRTGAAILLASHNMPEVERLCDYVLMMHKGRIVAEGAPAELIRRFGRRDMEEVFLAIARGGAAEGEGRA